MYNDFAKNQGLNLDSFLPEKKMGSPAESLEKKNIFLKKGDEIRRLDGTYAIMFHCVHHNVAIQQCLLKNYFELQVPVNTCHHVATENLLIW